MITNKNINKIILIIAGIAFIVCILAMIFSDKLVEINNTGVSMEYEDKIFNTDNIIDIDIQISEDDWQELLDNAINEEYYKCDVVINEKKYSSVAIRAKGNTSLSQIANDDTTDRYSLKLEFDRYIEGQSLYGLDKLILNNNYADTTNMKEAIVYDMFNYLGADSSLYNYAKISVNGEYWGVYLALEAVEESFALRNYGVGYGKIYKPDNMDFGDRDDETQGDLPDTKNMPDLGQNMSDFDEAMKNNFPPNMPDMSNMPERPSMPDIPNMPDDENSFPQNMGDNDFSSNGIKPSGFGGANSGATLNYIDDEIDSYSVIWNNAIFESSNKDKKRVIKAFKNISENNNIEEYMDVDNILKYMAVHTFVVNLDSLSGSMAHNYYLYEDDGKLNLIPWDYNLAFGGMSTGKGSDSEDGASSTINFPIDTPFSSGISSEDRQFFYALLNNEEYLNQYHEYLQKLVDEYVNGGEFEKTYSRIRSQIDELVQTDPNAFYSYGEYELGCDTLVETVKARAQSVKGQLDGTIPSTTEGQKNDSSNLIKTNINLSDLGTMNFGSNKTTEEIPENKENDATNNNEENKSFEKQRTETDGEKSPENTEERSRDFKDMRKSMTDNFKSVGESSQQETENTKTNLIIYGICFIVMILFVVFVKLFKRKNTL